MPVLRQLLELVLQARDTVVRALVVVVRGLLHLGHERRDQRAPARNPVRHQRGRRARGLEPQPDPLGRRPRRERARRQRLALRPARRQRRFGLLARRTQADELLLDRVVRRPCRRRGRLGGRQLLARHPRVLARERPARLVGLAREPLVQLRRLGLALQRPQPPARLALDVQGPIQVVLRPLELQLRPAPPLAVLAEPRGLLDQQPPVARLRGHDLLDPALATRPSASPCPARCRSGSPARPPAGTSRR